MLAAVGLVVSLSALWPRLDPGASDRALEPGPAADSVVVASSPEQRSETPDPGSDAARSVGRSDATALRRVTRQQRTPRPVRARLGSVDVDARVRPVGVQPDGQMQLPDDPRVLGWYRFGAAPGATMGGATVLAGHLDSRSFGLGPLVRLRDVAVDDTLTLTLRDGRVRRYVVRDVSRYDRQGLPEALFSRTGPERLHVITCSGEYDAENGGYQLNLVVTAVPVG
ncbi:class F sortase [Nocardioides sp.]|uniref:class F sortase n=1 Tax=Nocardioides sp. TaxID=35761 RepID=UPI003562A953